MKRSSNATRHLVGCLLLILGMSLAVGACGDDQPAGQGGTTGTSSDSGGTGGSGGAGGAGGEGGAGGAGGSTGTPCQQFCDLRAPVCADDDDSTCLTKCDVEYDKGVCKAEWAAAIDCVLTSGELVCNNGSPTAPDACDPAFLTYVSCLATSCYKDLGACNPLLDSCPAGRVCDPGDGAFVCRSASSPVPRGDDCDGSPACEHGTTCFFGRCTAFCCSDSDCGFGSCKYQATFAGPDGNIPLTLCDPY